MFLSDVIVGREGREVGTEEVKIAVSGSRMVKESDWEREEVEVAT